MIRNREEKRRATLIAATVLLLLAGLLAVRVTARPGPAAAPVAPPASVPPPATIQLLDLPTPFCWGCSDNQHASLEFQLDLDLLAPLGDGPANAALWFKDFAIGGSRHAEWSRSRTQVRVDGTPWHALEGDDPLLLEAEPWIDQARCEFHPDVFALDGAGTELPNLLMMLDLARSWVARGKAAEDVESARADFRRAIRLGRLLRQDDVTLIQDLVAIACIRIGAEAIYELAREQGDGATMVATSLVLADKDAIRLSTMRRMSVLERAIPVRTADGEAALQMTDEELDRVLELIRALRDRRFRIEGAIGLGAVLHLGPPEQREAARVALDEFAGDSDALFAAAVRHARDEPFDAASFFGPGD